MNKSFNTLLKLSLTLLLLNGIALADFKEHYDLGLKYMSQYQYPSAISEFRSALKINYLDNSARINLINAYLARGPEFANKDKAWDKAADDFRSALFYLTYYPSEAQANNSASVIAQTKNNLEICLNNLGYDYSAQNRYNTAKRLRAEGNFPAAAYEFMQALGNKNLQKSSFEQVAEIMKVLGNEPKAAEYYKKAIAISPSDMDLRLAYANVLDRTNNTEEALKEYGYVLQRANIEDKSILYSLEKMFAKKLSASPNNANLNANMGAVLQKQGRFDEALSYYKKAESLDPSNINTRINTGTLYQQKGDYKTAIKAYESVLILYPDNISANLYRAQCMDKLGDSKAAQEIYQKIKALDPNNEILKAQMLENAKNTMSAQQFVEYVKTSMSEMNPSEILYEYAIDLHKRNKISDAIYMYKSAISVNNGKNPEMFVNLALAQAQDKNFDEALSVLANAQKLYPSDSSVAETIKNISNMRSDSLMTLASDYQNKQDYQNAIETYKKIIPENVNSVLGIAGSYQSLGDRQKAIEYYKKALQMKPVDSDIAYIIACLYGENEDYASAKEYLQKAIVFNKNNTQAIEYLKSIEETDKSNLLTLAIGLYDENKLDESLVKFNELLSKDSQNAYAYYYRGMIYDSKEKRAEAIADLKKAYSLNNEFKICNYLIASDYDALGKYKDAYEYYVAYANSDVQDDEYKKYAKDRAEELKGNVGK